MKTFNQKHIRYLRTIMGDKHIDTFLRIANDPCPQSFEDEKSYELVRNCLIQMSMYEEPWWLSDDKRIIAYNQIKSQILLVKYEKFHKALEFLLKRHVDEVEIFTDYLKLRKEAEKAFNETK